MKARKLKEKVRDIDKILEEELGIPERWGHKDPLSSLVQTILSQNTNDNNSGRAYDNLREQFPSWEEVLEADAEEIADAIRVGGLANQKSVSIKGALKWLKDTYGELNLDFICDMNTDDAMEMLLKLKGVGLKTVNVMLCFACHKDVFPVDTAFQLLHHGQVLPGFCQPLLALVLAERRCYHVDFVGVCGAG